MAATNGLFSEGLSGRIGNMICYSWRGRQCVRTMPAQYRDAKTEQQLAQRAMFKAMVGFAAQARLVLKKGLKTSSLNAQMLETNYFIRINKGCFAIEDGTFAVDYESLQLSEGPVAPVAFDAPRLIDETTVHVDFEKNPLHRTTKSEDMVYIVAYCPELKTFDLSAPFYRYKGYAELRLHPLFAGKEVHLWGFVVDRNDRASMSLYIGCGILDEEQWPAEDNSESTEYESNTVSSFAPANVFRKASAETPTIEKNGAPPPE